MESILARGAQVLVALGGAYLLALWFVLIVWTFRDIETRSKSVVTQIFSTLLVVLFFVPGVLLYMILRPKESLDVAFQRSLEEEYLLQDLEELPLCMHCQHYVEDDFLICPTCKTQLREGCPACSRLVDLRWAICPYCGADQSRTLEEATPELEPAARWISPTVLRRRVLGRTSTEQPVPAAIPIRVPATSPLVAVALADDQDLGSDGPIQVPVRLFDRRKTRETARLAARRLEDQPSMDGTNGSNGHGVNGNGRVELRTLTEVSAPSGDSIGLPASVRQPTGVGAASREPQE